MREGESESPRGLRLTKLPCTVVGWRSSCYTAGRRSSCCLGAGDVDVGDGAETSSATTADLDLEPPGAVVLFEDRHRLTG